MINITRAICFLSITLITTTLMAEETLSVFSQQMQTSLSTSTLNSYHMQNANNGTVIAQGEYNTKIGDTISIAKILKLNLLGNDTELHVTNVDKKTADRMSYTASDINQNVTLHIAQYKGEMVGSLLQDGKLFKLRPSDDGSTLLIEVPNDQLIDHDDTYFDKFSSMNLENYADSAEITATGVAFTVIVAYTRQFAAAAGNVNAYMDLLEQETNTSYANSGVNTRVRIVHSYRTNYQESGDFYTDLNNFSNGSNSAMRELNNKRNQHRADLMILLTGNQYGYCGVARAIGASASTAFALAKESCATGYYSFGHEIGHLFGARHITYTDPSSSPFSYGHGYCNTRPGTWRTVMAYGCPSNRGGPRIQQWSNPNIYKNGYVTGTQRYENNARVMNVRASTIASFR